MFSISTDLDIFVEMVKLARKIAQSPSLKDLVGQYDYIPTWRMI